MQALLLDKVRVWAAAGGGLFAYHDPADGPGAVTYRVRRTACTRACACHVHMCAMQVSQAHNTRIPYGPDLPPKTHYIYIYIAPRLTA